MPSAKTSPKSILIGEGLSRAVGGSNAILEGSDESLRAFPIVSLRTTKKPPRFPGAALDSSEVGFAAYFFFAAFLATFFAGAFLAAFFAGAALPSSIAAWAAARRATGTR